MDIVRFRDIDVKDAVQMIVKHLNDNRMSLLVGAGASRCACDLYKSWYELLKDMVAFLYADELRMKGVEVIRDKKFYCHYKILDGSMEGMADANDVIGGIIEREGVLGIPSLFERRMGLRESIEAFIESHTPVIHADDNKVVLFDEEKPLGTHTEFLASMLNVYWNAVFTTNYDNLLYHVSKQYSTRPYCECCNAADLSLRKMRDLIIKLHGSIDFNHETNGFEQDKQRKYILTQEDYDDYPRRHEAFMQLMKISLLKDCLCLVGFSGRDPNFMSWINWVRDIIEMNARCSSGRPTAEDIKIFFIDIMGEEPDDAMSHFFENHRIYRICLTDEKVKEIIGVDAPNENSDEFRRRLFKAFFDHINKETRIVESLSVDDGISGAREKSLSSQSPKENVERGEGAGTKGKKEEREEENIPRETFSLWSRAYELKGNHLDDFQIYEDESRRLIRYRSYQRLVRGTHFQSYFIDAVRGKEVLTELEAQMALMALEQVMGDCSNEARLIGQIKTVLTGEADRERADRLLNRVDTLLRPAQQLSGESDMVTYERCVRWAFTFEYGRLREELKTWQPHDDFITKKAVLLSLVDGKAVESIFSQSLLDRIQPNVERFRATQIANILTKMFEDTYSTQEFAALSQYGIFSLKDWFFGDAMQSKVRIRAYGMSDGNAGEVNAENAVRCLNFMLEAPMMPQLSGCIVISTDKWYRVAHALFEKYPYPVLFYSSTLNDTDMLRRIGQDYAYSPLLHDLLPEMAGRMLRLVCDKESPLAYWPLRNLCVLLEEIIKAVPPSCWEPMILKLWKEDFFPRLEEVRRNDAVYKLICSALSCGVGDEILVSTVINDSLSCVKKKDGFYETVYELFYYLRTPKSPSVSRAIETSLTDYINKVDDIRDFIVLGNIYQFIDEAQCRIIAKKGTDVVRKTGIKTSLVNGLVYFAKSDKESLEVLKKALIESGKLWDNGLLKGGGFTRPDYIPVVALDESLSWTDDEILRVYDKLVERAKPFLESLSCDNELCAWMNWEDLLNEMMQFMDLHRSVLESVDGVDELYDAIEEKYKLLTGFVNLDTSIYSDDEDELGACLDVLQAKVRKEGIHSYMSYIHVLLTRLLCRNRHSFRRVLDYVQYYVRFHLKTREDLSLLPQLPQLLDALTTEEFRRLEQNVILCSELTILMAEHMQKLGVSCPGVRYWMKLKESRYFNWTICDRRME